ncbi:MAG: MotA/TolQ/ExbB proton channel family protein [Planctomycetaceae bacterium]|nr:MotA/TolQ/ExbB proton channel family protein [Planctomycetaceae bacterium]
MNIGAFLSSAIYLISSSLLYPTMVLLLAAFAVAVVSTGGILAEWLERARLPEAKPEEWRQLLAAPDAFPTYLSGASRKAFMDMRTLTAQPDCTWEQVEGLFLRIRHDMWKRLDYLRILVRVGPSLGLMGTLIPMGTGLAALGQGDIGRLSGDLIIAFTTTVVGLAVGIAAFTWYTLRRRWLERDMHLLLIAAELLSARHEAKGK